MRRVDWSLDARRELEELNEWYGELSPDLPLTFTLRIEASLARLLDFTLLGSLVPDSDKRKWRARRTPYLIFYRPTQDGIRILSVRHERSNWVAPD